MSLQAAILVLFLSAYHPSALKFSFKVSILGLLVPGTRENGVYLISVNHRKHVKKWWLLQENLFSTQKLTFSYDSEYIFSILVLYKWIRGQYVIHWDLVPWKKNAHEDDELVERLRSRVLALGWRCQGLLLMKVINWHWHRQRLWIHIPRRKAPL